MTISDGIYLDHAAGTFLFPEIHHQLGRWLTENLTNPSSIHAPGRHAAAILDSARQQIAGDLGCQVSEIIFTSGGTEANNLAILGLTQAHSGHQVISCRTEHPSVLESLNQLERRGFHIHYLSTDSQGRIDLDELQSAITQETTLISLMWVNNETGLIHPVQEIAKIAKERQVLFHSDAVQALGHIPLRTDDTTIDALSFSGHKIGAPAGIGVLYLRGGTALLQQSFGGSQENHKRAGTQNLTGARAFALAHSLQQQRYLETSAHFQLLQDQLQMRLSAIPGIQINRGAHAYSPHILNCSFHNVDGEALFIRLDMAKLAVSNGSACSSGSQAPSHVLTAMGFDKTLAQASLRISLGIQTTLLEINQFCDQLETIVHSIQRKKT